MNHRIVLPQPPRRGGAVMPLTARFLVPTRCLADNGFGETAADFFAIRSLTLATRAFPPEPLAIGMRLAGCLGFYTNF